MRRVSLDRVPVDQLVPLSVRPDEARYVRQIWWNQARLGHRMPAELGVILIDGSRR
jgi:hypothetical protein